MRKVFRLTAANWYAGMGERPTDALWDLAPTVRLDPEAHVRGPLGSPTRVGSTPSPAVRQLLRHCFALSQEMNQIELPR